MNEEMQALLEKQAIAEALFRYARGIDRLDRGLIAGAYHEDAHDDHGTFKGNAQVFAERVVEGLATLVASQHRLCNMLIDLQGEVAQVETYFYAMHVPGEEPPIEEHVFGRYLDRFEKRAGVWRIAHRRVVLDFTSVRPRGEPFIYESSFIRGVRGKDDPSYFPA